MDHLLEVIINSGKYSHIVKSFLSKIDISDLQSELRNIQINSLYKNSRIHGIYHSEKVLLFSMIIATDFDLNAEEFRIMKDAAIYHDIGRYDESTETLHGYLGAEKIETVVSKDEFYQNEEHLNLLKALIDAHSLSDDRAEERCQIYESEIESFQKLYCILKDADTLDRIRFGECSRAKLDKKFLRNHISKNMISFSKEINSIYIAFQKENNALVEQLISRFDGHCDCLHSIGFDFFKLNSILQTGILSKNEMTKKNLIGAVNFEGGNSDDWISVVDVDLIPEKYTGYQNFIRNGISFYCSVPYLDPGLSNTQKAYAMEMGLPFNRGNHKDEKYVYKKIPISQILSVIIPRDYCNQNIKNLNYIQNSLSFQLFNNRVNYYYSKISEFIDIDISEMKEYLRRYNECLEYYLHVEHLRDKYDLLYVDLEKIRVKINQIIENWMAQYFQQLLGKDEIVTIEDVVQFELNQIFPANGRVELENEIIYRIDTLNLEEKPKSMKLKYLK